MRLFTLDDSNLQSTVAVALRPHFNISADKPNMSLSRKSRESHQIQITLDDLKQSVWVAHSSERQGERMLGDYPPKQFADMFSEIYKNVLGPKKPSDITDLYVIACETGMGDNSVAQNIADELFKKGFTKVKVHAVASPVTREFTSMRVAVTHKAGVLKKIGIAEGSVRAYLLTADEEKQIAQAKSEKEKERIHDNANTFLETGAIKEELDFEHNTFHPNTVKPALSARKGVVRLLIEQAKRERIRRKRTELDEDIGKIRALENLSKALGNAKNDDELYQLIAKCAKKSFGFNKRLGGDPGMTRPALDAIVASRPETIKEFEDYCKNPDATKKAHTNPMYQGATTWNDSRFYQASSSVPVKSSSSEQKVRNISELKEAVDVLKAHPAIPELVCNVLESMCDLLHKLDSEIKVRKESKHITRFVYGRLLDTKQYKREQLKGLMNEMINACHAVQEKSSSSVLSQSLEMNQLISPGGSMYTRIETALSDKKLTAGIFGSRVRDLLREIIKGKEGSLRTSLKKFGDKKWR